MPRRSPQIWDAGSYLLVELPHGFCSKISPEDRDLVETVLWTSWANGRTRYVGRSTYAGRKRTVTLHRTIGERVFPDLQPSEQIDHVNGDGLDNRRENLRRATCSQNQMNCRSRRNSTSRFLGVSWYRRYEMWRASIKIAGKYKTIGYFDNEEEAARAYDELAKETRGERARLNFP